MESEEEEKPWNAFRDWIEGQIQIQCDSAGEPVNKIDLLERLLEQLRVYERRLENELEFENGLDWEFFPDRDKVVCIPPKGKNGGHGTGTPPIQLQRRLLVYLLGQVGHPKAVYNVIDDFISKIWDHLQPEDFKKTKTGVYRCFTNTRFAANKLREYGLLRFTGKEAFKTWVLSLPGILTAASALPEMSWHSKEIERNQGQELDPFIHSRRSVFRDYPNIVESLEGICRPNSGVFETFDPVLREAHRFLVYYWEEMERCDQSHKEKRRITNEIVEQLDVLEGMEEFMEALAQVIQVEELLSRIDHR